MKKGKNKYLPKVAIIELNDIKREDKLQSDSDAFREMVRYTRVGREVKRLTNFNYNWNQKATLPKINKPKPGRKKKKIKWQLEI